MPDIPEINFTVSPAESVSRPVDPSLSIEGMAADAKATGDALEAEQTAREEGLAAKLDTYSELESLEELEGTDELPVGHGGEAAKIDVATLAAALKTLGGYVSKTGDTLTGMLHVEKADGIQIMLSQGESSDDNSKVCIIALCDSTRSQLRFRAYAPGGSSYEDFVFPATPSDTSTTHGYDIYTDKNPPVIYREFAFNETVGVGSQLHKRIDSDGIAISGYTIIGTHVKMTSANLLACTVTANTYNDGQLFIHIMNQGSASAITGTVRVAYVKNA